MSSRRMVLLITGLIVAGLGGVFAVSQWDRANRIATAISALAAVAAVGVTVWAALPGSRPKVRVSDAGRATAAGSGSAANSGVSGPATLSGSAEVDRSGDVRATGGGSANSGIQLS